MRIEGIPTSQIILKLKRTLDIYPFIRNGRVIRWVSRAWPRPPKDISGNFKKTHQASKLVLDAYRATCAEDKKRMRTFCKHLNQFPLDWFRSMNQSLAYQFQSLPHIFCSENLGFDKETQKWTLSFTHSKDFECRIRYSYWENPKMPSFETTTMTRKGQRKCTKGTKEIPINEIEPFETQPGISKFKIPDKSYCLPILNAPDPQPVPPPPPQEIIVIMNPTDSMTNHLWKYWPYNKYGKDATDIIQNHPTLERRIIAWSQIPSEITPENFISAELNYKAHSVTSSYAHKISIYNLIQVWEELKSSWMERISPILWTKPGGTYDQLFFEESQENPGNIIADLTQLISFFLSGQTNNGFIIINKGSYTGYLPFYSNNAPNQIDRPYIKYLYSTYVPTYHLASVTFPIILNSESI